MKITVRFVRLPINTGKKRQDRQNTATGRYERCFRGHNLENSLEKRSFPSSASISNKKESDDVEGVVSDTGSWSSLDLSVSTVKALIQLVEHYNDNNDTLKEIATFSNNRKSAAHQPLATAEPSPFSLDEVKALMIAGTGDPLEVNAIMRRQLMIVESPAATPEILTELVHSQFTEVREAIADHRNCTEAILLYLSDDQSPEVRYALAENHRLSFSILEKLTHDDNPYVSVRAQRTMRRVLSNNVLPMDKRGDAGEGTDNSNLANA